MLDKPQDDDFDVAVEDAISERPSKRAKGGPSAGGGKGKLSRGARDKKFGFGGAGRRSKQNSRSSTDDFNPSSKKGAFKAKGGGSKRLGKSRRAAGRK